ncbi:MAG: hypothetical protein AAGH89_00990 [Verrucomicrobiota bacterium]
MNEISKFGALVIIVAHIAGYLVIRHYFPIVVNNNPGPGGESSKAGLVFIFATAFGVTAISKIFDRTADWTPTVWRSVFVFAGLGIAEAVFWNLNISWG